MKTINEVIDGLENSYKNKTIWSRGEVEKLMKEYAQEVINEILERQENYWSFSKEERDVREPLFLHGPEGVSEDYHAIKDFKQKIENE